MFKRNRLVAALGLTAALFLAVPSPSRAAGLRPVRLPVAALVERVWTWIAELWPAGGSSAPAARWEKEGSVIDPLGQPHTTTAPSNGDPDSAK